MNDARTEIVPTLVDPPAVVDPLAAVVDPPPEDGVPLETKPALPTSATPPEAAPADPAGKPPPPEAPSVEIDALVAGRFAEKQRADKLQNQLDAITNQPVPEPIAENFSTTEDYVDALVTFKMQEKQGQITQQVKSANVHSTFQNNVKAYELSNKVDNFNDMAATLPQFPKGVARTLMESDTGPEVIHHLAKNLNLAYKIASMSPGQATMELGKLQGSMTSKVVPTSAPPPTTTVSGGTGSAGKDVGGKMSMDDWMRTFNT